MYDGVTAVRVTASGLITPDPAVFFGLVCVATAAADTVAVLNGRDALSADVIHTFTAPAANSQQLPLNPGVHFDRGIYVTLSAGITEATIFFKSLRYAPQVEAA